MARIAVVGFGAMNIDRLYRVDELIIDGEQPVVEFVSRPGGSAANTIFGLAKLGVKTGCVGAVGMDEFGKQLIGDFKTAAVDVSQIKVKKMETGSTICLSDRLGRRAIYISPGANSLLNAKDIDIDYLNQAKLIHMTSFVDDRQLKLQLDMVKRLKDPVKISFSPGMLYAAKGLKALMPVLERTQIFFANRDEIEKLTGRYFKAGARELVKSGCRIVVVTLGKGLAKVEVGLVTAYICDGEKEYDIESERLSPKSRLETTGAGDAFAAGFLFGFLKGKSVEECGLLGDTMAGFVIRKAGARAGLPTVAQLSEKYLKRSGRRL